MIDCELIQDINISPDETLAIQKFQIIDEINIHPNNNRGQSSILPIRASSSLSVINTFVFHCKCFKVLIVDDDPMCVNYVKNVVKAKTTKIETASDGLKAFEKVKELIKSNCLICRKNNDDKIKLILFMDIHMPIMDGIESAKLINTFINSYRILVVCRIYFISGNIDTQYSNLIASLPICKGSFNKPIKKAELLEILSNDI